MITLRDYFIEDILKKTDDVFGQAQAILLLRLTLMFRVVFFLPVVTDFLLNYNKALIVHGIAWLLILLMPFIIKKQQNIERSVNLFFSITFIVSSLVFMMLAHLGFDPIGASWSLFFLILGVLLQRGKARLLFCCLNWLPVLYTIINTKLNDTLEWK